jgi:hypothetical protein
MRILRLLPVVAAALAVAPHALACGSSGYTYAGLASTSSTHGVAARLTAIGAPSVANGHVAGWVGVGGPGEGPNGTDEWIQVGLSGFAGSHASNLYYEVTRAGSSPQYVKVQSNLPPGTTRQVAVLEVQSKPDSWRVWVNGRPVSKPIYLPRSHGVWPGIATAESWTTTTKTACNSFGYRFDDIRVAQHAGGGWQTLTNPLTIRTGVNRLLRANPGSFEAISGVLSPVPAMQKPHVALYAGPMRREQSETAALPPVSRALR